VATIEHIQLVVSSGACISAVRKALDAGDFEALAESISSYQQLVQQAGQTEGADGPRLSTLSAQLEQGKPADIVVIAAREKLLQHVRQGVQSTLQAQDADAAFRYLKLYKPLELPDEGMAAALSFVKRCACMASLQYEVAGLEHIPGCCKYGPTMLVGGPTIWDFVSS
jgi:hypothetical protein